MTTMSRRKALRLTAATTAASLTVAPAALASGIIEPDPIYAAIERHRVAETKFAAVLHAKSVAEDRYYDGRPAAPTKEDQKRIDALMKPHDSAEEEASTAGIDAKWDLANTVPATLAGLAAALAYEREFSSRYRFDELFEGEFAAAFHSSTEQAVCALAGLPAPDLPAWLEEEETA